MLSRTFEWHRIVNAKPSAETIDNRRAAAQDLVKVLDDSTEWDIILEAAAGVVSGFESGFKPDSPIVSAIVGSIRDHDSAFPKDLAENALELRATTATALGELMIRDETDPDNTAIAIAALLRSGLYLRATPTAKFLKDMIEELGVTASIVLERAGEARRLRPELDQSEETAADPADLPTALNALKSLRESVADLVDRSVIDQEELNVLWWMFGGMSTSSKSLLSELPPGAAALACGGELGTMCLVPHSASMEAMARRAFLANRGTVPDRTIEQIAADWTSSAESVMVPDQEEKKAALAYPTLFPLSWLAARLLSSGGSPGWAPEFEQKTKLPAAAVYSYTSIAIQALNERSAQRLHIGQTGE